MFNIISYRTVFWVLKEVFKMSRSYKKSPYCTQQECSHNVWKDKRFANKAVRHAKDVPDGMAFKKYYSNYAICDYKVRKSFSEWFHEAFRRLDLTKHGAPHWTLYDEIESNSLVEWEKSYRRK